MLTPEQFRAYVLNACTTEDNLLVSLYENRHTTFLADDEFHAREVSVKRNKSHTIITWSIASKKSVFDFVKTPSGDFILENAEEYDNPIKVDSEVVSEFLAKHEQITQLPSIKFQPVDSTQVTLVMLGTGSDRWMKVGEPQPRRPGTPEPPIQATRTLEPSRIDITDADIVADIPAPRPIQATSTSQGRGIDITDADIVADIPAPRPIQATSTSERRGTDITDADSVTDIPVPRPPENTDSSACRCCLL